MVKGHTGYIADQDIFLASIDFLSLQGFVQMLGIGGFKWHHVGQGVLGTVACGTTEFVASSNRPRRCSPYKEMGLGEWYSTCGEGKTEMGKARKRGWRWKRPPTATRGTYPCGQTKGEENRG